jgi:small subunit ribosomal protein S2e
MADQGGDKKRGFGRRDQKGKGGRGPRKGDDEEWRPLTKLGRLVKYGRVRSLEEIFRFSIPIKEHGIVDHFLGKDLKEEVMKIMPVQKQTQAGQRTRFKAFVIIGDSNGHIGLGVKAAKEVQGAIKGAIIDAKLNIVPVRRGYWGNKIGKPHTVPTKVTGRGGSVRIRLVPAPRGTGIVGAPVPKKVLQFAGILDCYTASRGNTKTKGNTLKAAYDALVQTYRYLTPDLWTKQTHEANLFETHNAFLTSKPE